MSGHNKWSKIKRKKEVLDSKKSQIFTKVVRLIAMESKKAGGDKNAPGLRAAIEKAKEVSMPIDNIERAIQKGAGTGGEVTEEIIYEAYGPGGAALLIVGLTDNRNRTAQDVKFLLSKNGGTLGTPGSAMWGFTKTAEGYEPQSEIPLSPEDEEKLSALIEALEDHDDIQDVYTNAA